MNEVAARTLLSRHLDAWRRPPYPDLVSMVDAEPETLEIEGKSGVCYQIEVTVVWDDPDRGHLRVLGAIDDGGWGTTCPLPDDVIMATNGGLIGE